MSDAGRSHTVRTIIVMLGAAWIVLFSSSLRAVQWATYDDSYYYFGIARNLAHGWGSTFDRLHATNGYHPLWLGLCTLAFWLKLDDDTAVRALLSVQIIGLGVALALGVRVIERAAERRTDNPRRRTAAVLLASALLVLFAFSPFGISLYANGLESTCSLLVFAALVERLDACREGNLDGHRIFLSVLAAIAFLARTDAIVLVPWLAVFAVLRGGRARAVLEIALVPCLVIAGYLVFNRMEFGSATQVSGDLKRIKPTALRLAQGIAIALAPALGIAILRKVRLVMVPRTAAFVLDTAPLFGFACAIVAYYETLQPWQQVWYFVTPTFYLALVLAIMVVDLVAAPRWIPRIAGVGVVLGAAVFFAGSVRDALEPGATAMLVADREAGIWIRNNLEGSAVLGSWDAGALGYYSHRRVVSLDGEVGSVAFMRALRAGKTSEWDKSERVHVEYIVNHTFDEDGGSEKLRTLARDCFGEERTKRWTILWTWDFIYRGGANGKAPRTYGMAVWLARLD